MVCFLISPAASYLTTLKTADANGLGKRSFKNCCFFLNYCANVGQNQTGFEKFFQGKLKPFETHIYIEDLPDRKLDRQKKEIQTEREFEVHRLWTSLKTSQVTNRLF